ncbi:MAG: hypothetical protein D6797_09420 [Bdellovibrio sp.]|nr:MAG: hypothetical protein D6797_09420 [Bdellovibrio sp.]
MFYQVLLLALLVMGSSVKAALKEQAGPFVLCKNQKMVRTIRVERNEKGQCYTLYTKSGVDRVIGQARHLNSCMSFLNNVKNNLEKAYWSCKTFSKVTIDKADDNKKE